MSYTVEDVRLNVMRKCSKCGKILGRGYVAKRIVSAGTPRHWLCEECYKEVCRVYADK